MCFGYLDSGGDDEVDSQIMDSQVLNPFPFQVTLRRNKDAYSELEMHFHVSALQLCISVAQKESIQQNKIVIETKGRLQGTKNYFDVSQVLAGLEPPLDLSTTIFGHKVGSKNNFTLF